MLLINCYNKILHNCNIMKYVTVKCLEKVVLSISVMSISIGILIDFKFSCNTKTKKYILVI